MILCVTYQIMAVNDIIAFKGKVQEIGLGRSCVPTA